MRKFNLSRMAPRSLRAPARILAWGPLFTLLACSVYDDSLLGDVASPLGGSGGGAGGDTTTAGAGASPGGSSAGSAVGGSSSAGSDGVAGGGTASGATSNLGGGSGTSNVGGSAGSGGVSVAGGGAGGGGGSAGSPTQELIDDMEDGDAQIDLSGGRNGYWYVGDDLTVGGTTDPPTDAFKMAPLGAGDRSSFAAHLKASGFTGWGSVIGFNFVELATVVKPYDASAYCGVQFWGKAAAATSLRFRVPDSDTTPSGGVCVDGGAAGKACYDHFGAPAAFTTAWKLFSLKFADLTQVGSGYHPADMKLKTDKLYALEWALPGAGKTYEIWIDDVAFLKCK